MCTVLLPPGVYPIAVKYVQGGSNMTGTDCLQFTHKKSRSYLNHLVSKSIIFLQALVEGQRRPSVGQRIGNVAKKAAPKVLPILLKGALGG